MRRKFALIIFALFFITFLNGTDSRVAAQDLPHKRTVTVCVLSDVTPHLTIGSKTVELRPVPKEKIKKIIGGASKEYGTNAGITFEVVEYHDIQVNIHPMPSSQAEALRLACPLGEMVAVFTNQQMVVWPDPVPMPDGKLSVSLPRIYDGWSDPYYGITWIFSVEFWDVDKRGSSPVQTLKHEVGHLFDLEHSPASSDFMYEKGMSDAWSDRIREELKMNINTHWKMKPE